MEFEDDGTKSAVCKRESLCPVGSTAAASTVASLGLAPQHHEKLDYRVSAVLDLQRSSFQAKHTLVSWMFLRINETTIPRNDREEPSVSQTASE